MKSAGNIARNQRGVTLIELLAVIVILGIIAAIAAPNILDSFDNARENSDEATERILKNAAMQYIMDYVGGFAALDGSTDDGDGTENNIVHISVTNLNQSGLIEQDTLSWSNNQQISHVIVDKTTGEYVYTINPERPTDY